MTSTSPPSAASSSGSGGLLRRNPDFARLYTAALISFAGDWFTWVALQGLVLSTTGRPLLAGLMMATSTLPYAIVSPFAGVVVDRVDRKKLMIAADLVRAVVALGFLFARSEDTIWVAFACNALLSSAAPFFSPASSAAMPNLVATTDLARANVLMGSAWGTMLAVGAALGGLVAGTLGRDAAFVLDAASYCVSALLIGSIRGRFREREREPSHVTVMQDIAIAVRFARSHATVFGLLVVKTLSGLGGGPMGLISTMATLVFAGGDEAIGVLMAARGLGALAGPFLFRRFVLRGQDERIVVSIATAGGVFAIGYTAFAQSPNLWLAAVGVLVAHLGGGANWAMTAYALQRFTPDEVRGRIFAFDYALITLTMSASFVVAGFLGGRMDPRAVATWWSLAVLGAFALWGLWATRLVARAEPVHP